MNELKTKIRGDCILRQMHGTYDAKEHFKDK